MSKSITIQNKSVSQCPECNGKVVYQQEWDRLFDYYDKSMPAHDLVINRIYNDNKQPKYVCSACNLEVLVTT